jgi:hypothetical protein
VSKTFDLSSIAVLRERLNNHPVYRTLSTLEDLRGFMSHHIYSVWDFMSLLKCLQNTIAPTRIPWVPISSPSVRRFINVIVVEEESDIGLPGSKGEETYASHFELYLRGMKEIGLDISGPLRFTAIARDQGAAAALASGLAPEAAKQFMTTTFSFIATGKPHVIGAAFALGREQIIPGMFRALLRDLEIGKNQAPAFHYYLERHIHLDEDFHAPLSLQMLNELCGGDPRLLKEAELAAQKAIQARIDFWSGVQKAIARMPAMEIIED